MFIKSRKNCLKLYTHNTNWSRFEKLRFFIALCLLNRWQVHSLSLAVISHEAFMSIEIKKLPHILYELPELGGLEAAMSINKSLCEGISRRSSMALRSKYPCKSTTGSPGLRNVKDPTFEPMTQRQLESRKERAYISEWAKREAERSLTVTNSENMIVDHLVADANTAEHGVIKGK